MYIAHFMTRSTRKGNGRTHHDFHHVPLNSITIRPLVEDKRKLYEMLQVCSALVPPSRRINNNPHQAPRNDTCAWQGDEPAHVDPSHHAPIDGSPGAVAETHADGSTRYALGC